MISTSGTNPTFQVDADSIGWITFNDPKRKINVLSEDVMRDLAEALDQAQVAEREGLIQVLVIQSGKIRSFIAGADVHEITRLEDPLEAEQKIQLGQAIYGELANLSVPTIAAIHGICLGGGTEIALACQYRVLSDSKTTKIGLPEVTLGILPALGGTTRLPRLVGLQASLELLLTGKQIGSRKAQQIGFAQEVFPEALFEGMVRDFALDAVELPPRASRRKKNLLSRVLDDTLLGRKIVLSTARQKVTTQTGGHFPAPLRILDILDEHLGGSISGSLAAEARLGAELIVSSVSKNLLHVFHTRETARKGNGADPKEANSSKVQVLGVLGAGIMGGGISQLAAYNGVRVYMKDIRHNAITSGLHHAQALFDKATRRKKLSRRQANQLMELIAGGLEYYGISSAHLIIEAVAEQMDVKKLVLRETEEVVRDDCIITTNTSSLSVDKLAEELSHPDRFCGMHFFNPVHRMPLVEIVRGRDSSEETIASVYAFALQLGKVPVVVGNGPGFLVNRVLGPYLNEAGFLLEDGASIQQIDTAARAFGMPVGPLRLIDEIGFDISSHAGASLHKAFGERLNPSLALVALSETDRLGKKGGQGFYQYEKGRTERPDESIYGELQIPVPTEPQKFSDQEILARLVLQMINEATRALEDGIVQRADQVDLALIMGTGFPPFRGGLLRFADTLHPRSILYHIRKLEEVYGTRFTPAPLLIDLADRDRTFYQAFGT
jgi:3-hydroxyacyl-CoA dehydrogenase/enoyl-CoA hydratase/3-hydroxybutyryl-CoA epimerase